MWMEQSGVVRFGCFFLARMEVGKEEGFGKDLWCSYAVVSSGIGRGRGIPKVTAGRGWR